MKIFRFNPFARTVLYCATAIVYVFIFAPILFVVYASFDPKEIMTFPYSGFSGRWYWEFFESPTLYIAARNSAIVAATSSLLATVSGALAAYAVARTAMSYKAVFHAAIGAPLVISKVVIGVALLVLIVKIGFPRGFLSLILAHALLCLPFAYLVVWARLTSTGPHFEEAALTLGANDIATAVEITVPQLGAALAGAVLLCLTVSLDEFSASQFLVVPETETIPIQIFSMIQTGVSPLVNVVASFLTVLTAGIPLLAQVTFGAFQRTFVR